MRSLWLSLMLVVAGCGGSVGAGSLEAPIADPGDDRVVLVGESTTLSGLLSCDPSGGGLHYSWTLLEKPDGSALVLANGTRTSVQFGFRADVAGTYLFELIVTNGSRVSVGEIVSVQATEDPALVVTPSNTPPTEDRCGNPI